MAVAHKYSALDYENEELAQHEHFMYHIFNEKQNDIRESRCGAFNFFSSCSRRMYTPDGTRDCTVWNRSLSKRTDREGERRRESAVACVDMIQSKTAKYMIG